jgi:cell division septum initiation protein DivIVA
VNELLPPLRPPLLLYPAAGVDELYRSLAGELDALVERLVEQEGRAAAVEARAAQLDGNHALIVGALPRLSEVLDAVVRRERDNLDRILRDAQLQAAAEREAASQAADRILDDARAAAGTMVRARSGRVPVARPTEEAFAVEAAVAPQPASDEGPLESAPEGPVAPTDELNEQFWREEREATGARVLARTSMYTLAQAAAVLLLVTLVLARVG